MMNTSELHKTLAEHLGQMPPAERKRLAAAEPELAGIIDAMPLDESDTKESASSASHESPDSRDE